MRKRRLNQYGYYESILAGLRLRFNTIDGSQPGGGGGAPAEIPDVEPINGGEERSYDSLANGEVSEPVGQSANPSGFAQAQARTPSDPNQRTVPSQLRPLIRRNGRASAMPPPLRASDSTEPSRMTEPP